MFQYAAGRALAVRLGIPLELDISGFDTYRLHQGFHLSHAFCIDTELASVQSIHAMLGWQSGTLPRRWLRRPYLKWLRKRALVMEPSFTYWDGWRDLAGPCYLSGYWQSPKYFLSAESQLRADFSFRHCDEPRLPQLLHEVANCQSVAIHVRRGDYITNPAAFRVHGVCSTQYYANALRCVEAQVESPNYYVFSDDMAWVRTQEMFPSTTTYVQLTSAVAELQLMSTCRHQIIANSTFSWWAAWLNQYPQQLVVAPKRWFSAGLSADDLIPRAWLQI